MPEEILYPEEIKAAQDERLFRGLYLKNFPADLHHLMTIEVAVKKSSLTQIATRAIKEHYKKNPLKIETFTNSGEPDEVA